MTAFALEREHQAGFAQINITPLVDVLLVLLVIFMITAPMITQRLSLDFSQCKIGCPQSSDPVRLSIKQTGELYWNGVAINRAELDRNLNALAQQRDPPMLSLHPQAHARYEWIAQVLTSAKNANLSRISVEPASN
jgi:biopolymer transport protein ExbD